MSAQLPPAYRPHDHDPEQLQLPSVPQNEIPRPTTIPSSASQDRSSAAEMVDQCRLPPIQSLLYTARPGDAGTCIPVPHSSPRLGSTRRNSNGSSAMEVDGAASSVAGADSRPGRAGSVVSMDDPDVRIAAEALGDLRADFIQSPQQPAGLSRESPLSFSPRSSNADFDASQQQEPLLALFTTSHPILSNAINGPLWVYSSSKNISPSFIRHGAELLERNIGSPVASTFGSMGRSIGVEDSVRRYLGSQRTGQGHSESDDVEQSTKRRRVSRNRDDDMDVERGLSGPEAVFLPDPYARRRESGSSIAEALPAYDDHRSPCYEDRGTLVTVDHKRRGSSSPPNSSWPSRFMISTSGLGVAMSEESLRRLKFCLRWLRCANVHIGNAIVALRDLLWKWEQSQKQPNPAEHGSNGSSRTITGNEKSNGDGSSLITTSSEEADVLTERIKALKEEVVNTLKKAVEIVSTYAGAALPENARDMVRRQLTSLPRRFHVASAFVASQDALQQASETRSSAQRVLVLAREGLDMIAQVSGVLDGTIVSAEEWCDRLGRRRRDEQADASLAGSETKEPIARNTPDDVEMTGQDEKMTG
ncbi:MAG: hypothetical protein M1837_006426 [Sclerophora amabilis]|nr:MAG: hypothetical protein M1837_006426 [Sclerophora amabilis]